ncbi:MAG: hypothetical protein K6F51_09190 [Acetatifactor sp.]|nr:hypothetical protein [Acetatifactor sp.]
MHCKRADSADRYHDCILLFRMDGFLYKKTAILLSVFALYTFFSDELASLIKFVANPKLYEEIRMNHLDESVYQAFSSLDVSVTFFMVFLSLLCMFLCYLTVYESKKILRAFLSSCGAYVICQYVNNTLIYFYVYYTGENGRPISR